MDKQIDKANKRYFNLTQEKVNSEKNIHKIIRDKLHFNEFFYIIKIILFYYKRI